MVYRAMAIGAYIAIAASCADSDSASRVVAPQEGSGGKIFSGPARIASGRGLPMPLQRSQRMPLGEMLRRNASSVGLRAQMDVAGVTGEYSGLAWENRVTGEIALWYIDRWQPVEAVRLGAPPLGWKLVAAADFDTDGEGDLVFENLTTGERALWMIRDGVVTTSASLGIVPTTWNIASAGNADGDGYADILWKNSVTGMAAVWYMNKADVYNSIAIGQVSPSYPSVFGISDPGTNGSGIPTNRFDTKYYVLVVGNPATGAMAEWVLSDWGVIVAGRPYPSGINASSRFGAIGQFNSCSPFDWVVHDQASGEVSFKPDPTTSPIDCANGVLIVLGTVDPVIWKLVAGFPLHSPTKGVLVFEANQFPDKYWRTTGCVGLCAAFTVTPPTGNQFAATRPTVFRDLTPGDYRIDLRCQSNFSFETFCPVGGNSTQTVTVTAGGRTEVAAVYH